MMIPQSVEARRGLGALPVPGCWALALALPAASAAASASAPFGAEANPNGIQRIQSQGEKKMSAPKQLKAVESLPGSPVPQDIFEPHMPGVDLLSDMDALFTLAREDSLRLHTVMIVTPGRILFGMPTPESVPPEAAAHALSILGTNQPLEISVVSYNKLEALIQDRDVLVRSASKCIPFLGHLLSFAWAGHCVVVFEGHPSAFEAGVRNTNVLIIDSAMLPFLQEDWAPVAFRVMQGDARIFVHKRENHSLIPVALANNKSGWRYTEPDGEASYANCLMTTIAKAGHTEAVRITAGLPLPDLNRIATDPAELEWVSTLPFQYDKLDAEQVIDILVGLAKPGLLGILTGSRTLQAKLALPEGKAVDVSFKLTESRTKDGRRQLEIELR